MSGRAENDRLGDDSMSSGHLKVMQDGPITTLHEPEVMRMFLTMMMMINNNNNIIIIIIIINIIIIV